MFKVVYDTNVVVSGLLSSRGAPSLLLDLVFNRRVSFFLSPETFDEYERVLRRAKFAIPKQRSDSVLRLLRSLSQWVEPRQRVTVATDPDDNVFLECALAGEVDFLVTGNTRHFPKTFRRIQVFNPRQFLDIYLRLPATE